MRAREVCQSVLQKKSSGIHVSNITVHLMYRSFLTAKKKKTDKTSNCVGEVGRWDEVLR